MQVETRQWQKKSGWGKSPQLVDADLVIYFAGQGILDSGERYHELRQFYPRAHLLGCSTGGEIYGMEVLDSSISIAALQLKKTSLKAASTQVSGTTDSFAAGKRIAQQLANPDLRYVFLLSDGTNVNGSDLIHGLYDVLPRSVIITGGLAGDAADFKKTLVGLDAQPQEKLIAAVGFYGDAINVGYGSVGGWNNFGPERRITKSRDNVLYELDGKPALKLYKEYLGDDAAKLPGSALLFPLSIRPTQGSENITVRTIVGVDEKEQSMTFAGDMPEGYVAQLMRGDFNNLVDGALQAASLAINDSVHQDSLAILVSCIGRKLLLGQSISDETEAVSEVFNRQIPTIGFYSYGEICHQQFTRECSLHNQTMTVSVLHEK